MVVSPNSSARPARKGGSLNYFITGATVPPNMWRRADQRANSTESDNGASAAASWGTFEAALLITLIVLSDCRGVEETQNPIT
jgi:hypothetical protein